MPKTNVAILPDSRPFAFQRIMIAMGNEYQTGRSGLRGKIAAAAARLIAEDGASYETAKKKAVRQILGNARLRGEWLPDNQEIEEALRTHQALFMGKAQQDRLQHLRQSALRMMMELAEFNPHLTGAALNGTAGVHSHIHLQLFTESAKDVEICLLNQNRDISVTEAPFMPGNIQATEAIHFCHEGEVFHLSLFHPKDQRKMARSSRFSMERADINTLKHLLENPADPSA